MDTQNLNKKNIILSYFSLFTSLGTILCCALPSLLVALGLGASFAGLIGAFPQIVWLSENKPLVFGLSGILILTSSILHYKNRNAPCPIDFHQAQACQMSRKLTTIILGISLFMWLIGFLFAYIIPLFLT